MNVNVNVNDDQPDSYGIDNEPERRHSGDDERARVSAELKSTMELIMAFEDQMNIDNERKT